MKTVLLLYDGMADRAHPELSGGQTPMEIAQKPNFDRLGADGEVGMIQTVAAGLSPGSDVANLSVLGYDPEVYYTGRSPLEAVSIGVPMEPEDLFLRCNLVTLSGDSRTPLAERTMQDYSGGDISTEEARVLIQALQEHLPANASCEFHTGTQYRHCVRLPGGKPRLSACQTLTPPHDITDRCVRSFLPQDSYLLHLMEESAVYLAAQKLDRKANAIWLWGAGTTPSLPAFSALHGIQGSMISAVDLLRGIAILAGLSVVVVPGMTGWLDTNYIGKAEAAIQEFQRGQDFVFLHFEATDEAGHRGDAAGKVRGIELIDELVLPRLLAYLESQGDFSLAILPDHATPLALKTHTSDPVPYLIYRSTDRHAGRGVPSICEKSAAETGNFCVHGPEFMNKLLNF